MSLQLIDRSPALKRLRDEGYNVAIRGDRLTVGDVPYVNSNREVKRGTLVVQTFNVQGGIASSPTDHVVFFAGEHPCDDHGHPLANVVINSAPQQIDETLTTGHTLSRKPIDAQGQPRMYVDYYEMMSTYVAILCGYAEQIDRSVTARTYPVIVPGADESVFNYLDTASSRAGITAIAEYLSVERLAIVGLGGTGSYVLDLIAKVPIKQIHLFDGDKMLNHNAFRSPGAPTVAELEAKPNKATFFAQRYSAMHRHIIAHEVPISEENVERLKDMSFVFLCADDAEAKRMIAARLGDWRVSFIDVGMGLYLVNERCIAGTLRVTASDEKHHEHIVSKKRITGGAADDPYAQNIQVADLNALNAALAVVRWKKMYGFYNDLEHEYNCSYEIDGNHLLNEDQV